MGPMVPVSNKTLMRTVSWFHAFLEHVLLVAMRIVVPNFFSLSKIHHNDSVTLLQLELEPRYGNGGNEVELEECNL